ncbi:MAG: hypothetical protein K2W96_20210 [Gemmataceae bacterium]|nr:hypothetical protein [Gemmataceae bacterium]
MTAEAFDSILNTFRYAKPFHVFTVEMVGGRLIEVDHADALVFRDGVAIYVAPGGRPHVFDHHTVSMFHPMSRPDVRKADAEEASGDAAS